MAWGPEGSERGFLAGSQLGIGPKPAGQEVLGGIEQRFEWVTLVSRASALGERASLR